MSALTQQCRPNMQRVMQQIHSIKLQYSSLLSQNVCLKACVPFFSQHLMKIQFVCFFSFHPARFLNYQKDILHPKHVYVFRVVGTRGGMGDGGVGQTCEPAIQEM